MMKRNLNRLEAQLRSLFEEKLPKILGGEPPLDQLAEDLAHVMYTELPALSTGEKIAPHQFLLQIPAEDWDQWETQSALLEKIASNFHQRALQSGYRFAAEPAIELAIDPSVGSGEIAFTAINLTPQTPLTDTAAIEQPELSPSEISLPENAFLIIGGKTNFPLDKTVVNIGRHSDNDLVISDEYTSRHHAQLRAINQRYVIFDVGSTGGLLLNGKPISQATLQPGDVIKIGRVHLIYNQDSTGAHPTSAVSVNPDAPGEPSA